MRTRAWFLILLVVSAPAWAETVPDFSGVFLSAPTGAASIADFLNPDANPMILNIEQNAETLKLTKTQSKAEITFTYSLDGKPTFNWGAEAVKTKDRIKYEHRKLEIVSDQADRTTGVSGRISEQVWTLSPDLQTLSIRPKGTSAREERRFIRQRSLLAALQQVQGVSVMDKCQATRNSIEKLVARDKWKRGFALGLTGFDELGWTVTFFAGVGGEFFDDVKREEYPAGVEFYKDSKLIRNYAGSLTLEVTPHTTPPPTRHSWPAVGMLSGSWSGEHLPSWLETLRFRVRWVGSATRDLGEFPADASIRRPTDWMKREPWPELRAPDKWYAMQIPAQDVPLTDSLEVRIFTADGVQLGCICGHI